MSEILSDILIRSERDLKGLIHVQKYLEEGVNKRVTPVIKLRTVEAISAIVSACNAHDKRDLVYLGIIVDAFVYIVHMNKGEDTWNKFGFELGNLIVKMLSGIEGTEKFEVFFWKLLTSISVMCERNANTWRQVARPLLNVFINKKFDCFYLERTLNEFRKISKCVDTSEMINFTRQNLHLLRGFSMLVRRAGDFLLQLVVVELVFLFIVGERSLVNGFFTPGSQKVNELMEKLEFINFEKDSRILLNELNASLGCRKQVFSINCNLIYFGSVALEPPPGMDGIWMDVNQGSRRISISCSDFLSKSVNPGCFILQLPLSEVDKLNLEFVTLSGEECYCITLRINGLAEMYQFTKGHMVVCKALGVENSRDAITDFVRITEELSENSQRHVKDGQKKMADSSDFAPEQEHSQPNSSDLIPMRDISKVSCTSPVIVVTGGFCEGTNAEDNSGERGSQTSCTSPMAVHAGAKWENIRTYAGINRGKKDGEGIGVKKEQKDGVRGSVLDPNLQVNQISSSVLESRHPIDCSLNVSWNSCQSSSTSQGNDSARVQKLRSVLSERVSLKSLSNNVAGKKEEGVEGGKRNFSRRLFEEWASSSEDFVPTQKFIWPGHKENLKIEKVKKESVPSEAADNKSVQKLQSFDWLKHNKKCKATRRRNTESALMTSLLDPDGYSYRRWKLPTTSERSNFWLNKLKGIENNTSNAAKDDIFHFSEDDLSDESNVFRKRSTRKLGKVGVRASKAKTPERRGFRSLSYRSPRMGEIQPKKTKKERNSEGSNRADPPRTKETSVAEAASKCTKKQGGSVRGKDDNQMVGPVKSADAVGGEPVVGEEEVEDKGRGAGGGVKVEEEDVNRHPGGEERERSEADPKSPASLADSDLSRRYSNLILGSHDETDYSKDEDESEAEEVAPAGVRGLTSPGVKRKNCATEESATAAMRERLGLKKTKRNESELPDASASEDGQWVTSVMTAALEKVSLGMDQFLSDLRKRQVEETSNYLKVVERTLSRVVDEEEEQRRRLQRFEVCAAYFAEGCTLSAANGKSREDIEKIRRELNKLTEGGKSRSAERRMSRFAGRLKDAITSKAEVAVGKQLKELKIRLMESFLLRHRKQ